MHLKQRFLGWISMRLNIHEMKQAAQLVLDWHCYLILIIFTLNEVYYEWVVHFLITFHFILFLICSRRKWAFLYYVNFNHFLTTLCPPGYDLKATVHRCSCADMQYTCKTTPHCGAVANYTAINYMAFIRRICGFNRKSMNVFVFPLRSSRSMNIYIAEGDLRTHLAHVSTSHRHSASRGSPCRPGGLPTRHWVLCAYLTPKHGLLTIRHRGIKIVSFY